MFKHISQILQANQFSQSRLQEIIISLLPNGKIEGNSYVALNPTRHDRTLGSFRIDLVSGKWIDFATGDRGRDIVSLYAYVKNISQSDSARFLLERLGTNFADKMVINNKNYSQIFSKPPKPPQVQGESGSSVSKVSLKFSKVRDFSKTVNLDQTSTLNFALKIWSECKPAKNTPPYKACDFNDLLLGLLTNLPTAEHIEYINLQERQI